MKSGISSRRRTAGIWSVIVNEDLDQWSRHIFRRNRPTRHCGGASIATKVVDAKLSLLITCLSYHVLIAYLTSMAPCFLVCLFSFYYLILALAVVC